MNKEVNQEERTPRTVGDVKEMLTKHSNGEIQRTIQNCITILQNDRVLADADKIVVIKDGQIIDEGTHENLLTSCTLYQEMWKAHMDTKDVA